MAAGANPDPQNRRGAIILNAQRAEITQSAGQCIITLAESAASFAQSGGTGRVDVRASSALCTWTSASAVPWITLRSGATGQGSSPVTFEVAATTGPPRTAQLTIAEQQFSVTQSEGCAYAIAPSGYSAPAVGGSGSIAVTTTAACPWTASSNADWIAITQGSAGTGPGAIMFSVAPAAAAARTGTVLAAGQVFTVSQAAGGPGPNPPPPPPPVPPPSCAYVVAPTSHAIDASGGSGTVSVTAGNGCPWTASSAVPWIAIQGPTSGTASGSVAFVVAAAGGSPRSGTLTVAGQTVTVTQSPGCTFAISPDTQSVPPGGGTGSVAVTSAAGCAWTAASNTPWLTISSGASGSGNGTVQFAAAATTGPSRSGSMTIAGRTFTVNQGQGCTFTLSPSSATVPAEGAQVEFDLQTEAGCAWTASESSSWMSVSSGTMSGTGPGRVRVAVNANDGPARTEMVTAGGRAFTVTQASGCSYTLSETSRTVDAAGGSGSVGVTTSGGCSWQATSQESWIVIGSGASGSGSGSVSFTVAANAGAPRTGTLTVAGRTFTVNQGQSCSFTIAPEQQTTDAAGGNATVAVTTAAGCGWTASSQAPWISVTSGASGSGNGSVQLTVAANSGAPRSGTATIAGRTFTVNQGQSCAFTIAPEQQTIDAAGGNATVAVTTGAGCGWTASSQAPWISITSGASGSGNGSVQLTVAANSGAPRSGTATIAGRTFTVNQGQSCAFSIAPEQQATDAAGGNATVAVTTAAGCGWTASSQAPWISITSGASGSGNGSVQLTIAANAGAPRSGTATIAGRTFTVNQGSGCSFSVSPAAITSTSGGGPARVDVTTDSGCAWSSSSAADWVTITAGSSGMGSGAVDLAVAANQGPARDGVLTVAGRSVTVSQDSGCAYVLSAAAQSVPAAGGSGSVSVTAGPGCAWTAASQADWITVTAGTPGSGDGSVQFTVAANATGSPRSGTILVAGQTFRVDQE